MSEGTIVPCHCFISVACDACADSVMKPLEEDVNAGSRHDGSRRCWLVSQSGADWFYIAVPLHRRANEDGCDEEPFVTPVRGFTALTASCADYKPVVVGIRKEFK